MAVVDEVTDTGVEEFTDSDAGVTQHDDRDPGEHVVQLADSVHERCLRYRGGSARGSVSSWRGMSASNRRRPGVSAHPHDQMSSREPSDCDGRVA